MPLDRFSWDAPFKDYKPVSFTDSSILGASFADPHDLDVNILPFNGWDEKRKRNRMTFDTSAPFRVTDRRPLNPIGRTGISGRGLLSSWGPNHGGVTSKSTLFSDLIFSQPDSDTCEKATRKSENT